MSLSMAFEQWWNIMDFPAWYQGVLIKSAPCCSRSISGMRVSRRQAQMLHSTEVLASLYSRRCTATWEPPRSTALLVTSVDFLQQQYSLALWPWASHLPSLRLHGLILESCKLDGCSARCSSAWLCCLSALSSTSVWDYKLWLLFQGL